MSDRVAIMNEGYIIQIGTPKDVYEEPASLYVASFIGEANIFDAVVSGISENHLTLEIENKRYSLVNKKGFLPLQTVHLVIRPEDIAVWGAAELTGQEKSEMLPGIVEQVIYKGSIVDLIVRLSSGKKLLATEFFNEDDEKLDYHINEKVWIDWIPGWEVILPNEK
jgi:spermidine/putrescine transport system ATP-binding protein